MSVLGGGTLQNRNRLMTKVTVLSHLIDLANSKKPNAATECVRLEILGGDRLCG